MDFDDLSVTHRLSGKPVYRLAGCSRFFFESPGNDAAAFARVWSVAAECIGMLDEASHWIGPLDNRARRFSGDLVAVRETIERDRNEANERFDGSWLRVYADPDPPRQQFTLSLNAPGSDIPFAGIVLGQRPSGFLRHPDEVVAQTLHRASALRPHVGLVGFCLLSEPGMEPQHIDSAWPYLERYPGLQLPYQLDFGAEGTGIPHIDWLTVLGAAPLEVLGGVSALRRRLEDAAGARGAFAPQLIAYDGGVIVRAGEAPQLRGAEDGAAPLEYQVVDAALRELRWDGRATKPNHVLKVSEQGNGISRTEATLRWAARFE